MIRPLLWLLLCAPTAEAQDGQTPVEPDAPLAEAASIPTAPPAVPAPPSAAAPAAPAPVAQEQTWVGVISVLGSRKIPLLGKVEFQTDTYVLAKATRRNDAQWDVVQTTCRVQFPRTMGAEITMNPGAFAQIPKASFSWVIGQEGTWAAGPWKSGWDESDHDLDEHPGMTLHIAAPFCGGDLYASSEASQTATGRPTSDFVVAGDIRIHVIQDTLGTRGPCLRLMAKDSDEWMDGKFKMRAVPEETTCDSDADWPTIEW